MSLKQWADNGWLRPYRTTTQEIQNLLAIAQRDPADARSDDISDDWRFGIVYNATLKLCTILLYAEGYRPSHELAHYRTLQALPLILGDERKEDAVYLDACRTKRNTLQYDSVGAASAKEAEELIQFADQLSRDVLGWLRKNHRELGPL